MYRFSIRRLLLAMLAIGVILAFATDSPHLKLIAIFASNDDVVLNSSCKRIDVTGATSLIALFGTNARETLIQQLDNPNKFAAAHVALTQLESPNSKHQMALNIDGPEQNCNRMKYSLNGKSNLQFDLSGQPPLKRWWRDYLPRKDHREQLIVCSGILVFGDLEFPGLDDVH